MSIRILFFADTHLGFDLPRRPRVVRRRRGDDFFANYDRLIQRARTGNFDAVLHGGDVFFRSRVSPDLVQKVFRPLKRLADDGLPTLVVPGNHERSKIPHPWLAEHPGVFVFNRPRSFRLVLQGKPIVFAGFPYVKSVRAKFPELVNGTAWYKHRAHVAFLCVHHCFEGATVGPGDFTFRHTEDVIRHADVPAGFSGVLSGHIHRHQVLQTDLSGRPLGVPVFYPGSIERTSMAESGEQKGYIELSVSMRQPRRVQVDWTFQRLPARDMITAHFDTSEGCGVVGRRLAHLFRDAPRDAIVSLRVHGELDQKMAGMFTISQLRSMAPSSMNIEVRAFRSSKPKGGGVPPSR